MKNRTYPFGYRYENGLVVIHPIESLVLKQIFSDYLAGNSLLTIANHLVAQKVEYTPGAVSWNKARIMRIIQDPRYLGEKNYPALIEKADFDAAQKCKAQKNNQKNTDRQAGIYKLSVPVLCPRCGRVMTRCCDNRRKCSVKWVCKEQDCRLSIGIKDEDILGQITELLNCVIRNPHMIEDIPTPAFEKPLAVRKLENEINREVVLGTVDTETLKKKMLECLSLKYKSLPSERNTAKRLRVDFTSSCPLADFSADFANKTISDLYLREDGTVELVLRNGQVIRRE